LKTLSVDTDGVLYALVLALAASLPFEPVRPLLALGFVDLNHLKLLLAATAVVWAISLRRHPARDGMPRGTLAIGLFLALAVLSALLATSHSGEALKVVGRFASGLYALLLVQQVVKGQPARISGLLWAVCLGAGGSALLGFGEVAGWPVLEPLLNLFKLAPTHVGGDLRLSASFQYATIAAMFFELAVPLAVVLAATSVRRWQQILAISLAMLCSAAVALTLTRAGLVALAAACALMFVLAWLRPRLRTLLLPTSLAAASAVLVLSNLALRFTDFTARLGTENDWGWYAASYAVPDSLGVETGAPAETVVTAANTGQAVWTTDGEHPFGLAYRWLSADASSQLVLPATVLSLPHEVRPGEAVQLTIRMSERLPPGDYRLAWGMLQRQVLWFHDRGSPDAETRVHVAPGAAAADAAPVAQEPREDTLPGLAPVSRTELWRAALQMFAQRPLLGIGPDNFRHLYGAYVGRPAWDERVHANNLYLELLADLGVLGTAALGLVIAPAIGRLVRGVRSPSGLLQGFWLAGFGASLLAFFVHSTLDYFLAFTPVYLLFWLIVGLSTAVDATGSRVRAT
jgi:O-antigen ligase